VNWTGNSCDSLKTSRAREDATRKKHTDWTSCYDKGHQVSNKWKTPQYVRPHQVSSPPQMSPWMMSALTPQSSLSYPLPLSPPLLQSPPHPLDFPLLYHLLMLQNYCHQNYQEFYQEQSTASRDHHENIILNNDISEPLDLSSKSESDSNSVSGFLTEDNKISYDESIKHSEEVEVVFKDDIKDRSVAKLGQKKEEESVKDFVSRKIKEHKKHDSSTEVKRFLSEANPREKDIEKKMTKIKKKYCHIHNKIRKLDERKLKLKTPSNPPKAKSQPFFANDDLKTFKDMKDTTVAQNITHMTKTEPPSPSPIEKEAVKRKLSFDEIVSSKSDAKKKYDNYDKVTIESDNAIKDQDDPALSDPIYLDPDNLRDSDRVLLLQDAVLHPGRLSVILAPDIYGVKVDRERGNRPHILSREELLIRAVRDVRPSSVSELSMGARVCVYWSSKMSFLHPGLVTGFPPEDPEYIIVSTDDGDTRDVHLSQVRFLPHTFSTIDKK